MLATHPLLSPKTHKGFLVLVSQYLLTMSETWFRGRHVALMAVLLVRSVLQYAGQERKDGPRWREAAVPGRGTGCTALSSVSQSLLHQHAGQGTKGGYSTVASQHNHSIHEWKEGNLNIEHTLLLQWKILIDITASKTKWHYPDKTFSDGDKREVLSNMATKMSKQFSSPLVNISIPKLKLMACTCAINALL